MNKSIVNLVLYLVFTGVIYYHEQLPDVLVLLSAIAIMIMAIVEILFELLKEIFVFFFKKMELLFWKWLLLH